MAGPSGLIGLVFGGGLGQPHGRPGAELDRRILAVRDEYIETDDQRRDQPTHGGMLILHRLADAAPPVERDLKTAKPS